MRLARSEKSQHPQPSFYTKKMHYFGQHTAFSGVNSTDRNVAYHLGMTRLLHDRYLPCDGQRAWDLATGDLISLDDAAQPAAAMPASSAVLIEVLDHGRDGGPRWVVTAEGGAPMSALIRRAASDARASGFVPLSVDMYLRLREVLTEELQGRTLMLIASSRTSAELTRQAFVDAAARSPRPHVLLVFQPERSRSDLPLKRLGAGSKAGREFLVREAPAAYQFSPPVSASRQVPLAPDIVRHVTRAHRAREFVRAGCHAAAERLLRDVAGALVRRRAFDPAARTLISLGRVLLERGRAADADQVFDEGAGAAREGTLDVLGVDARIWQAVARTDAGRLTAAESLCRALLLTGALPPERKSWAEATLARVLWWQGRIDEVRSIDLPWPLSSDLDEVAAASIASTAVRLLIHRDCLFEAGRHAREILTTRGASDDPLVRAIASMAYLRVLCVTGDLTLAEQCLVELTEHAREARAPLRAARARLLWAETLLRAGRTSDAEREMSRLRRMRNVAPPLLRGVIDRRLGGQSHSVASTQRHPSTGRGAWAAALVKIVQEEERDDQAVRAVLSYVAETLNTSRIDVVCNDAGPVTGVLSIGTGIPTRLGERVLEAGITIGPERGDVGREIGVPVRVGQRLLAAVVARWAMDTAPVTHAAELLELAAAVAASRVEAMSAASRETAAAAVAVPELVGVGASMIDVRKAIARAALAPFAVLIEGESGVGKELVARAIHQLSPRRERRFCDVNCAALPEDLLESELFGHARGAFTGAVADRSGLFEDADGGTVFLDEVVDLSPRAQAKLLRVLQQHEVRRVGEGFSRKIDVRIVSAANREMRSEAAEGRFRQDLLYRLDVIRIRIPPLRERPEDIPILAHHFWRTSAPRVGTSATLTHGVIAALSRYHWPGNVRELQNVIAAIAVAAPSRGRVRPSLLPSVVTGASSVSSARLSDARAQFERRFIEVALARAGGSRARAAREIGVSRQGLLKMINRLGLP